MTNTKITAESFLDNKKLREQTMERIEILDKVKQLFLIPELECMTVKQVADYFEVELETIQWQYKNNKDEFDEDGVSVKKLTDFKSLGCSLTTSLKMATGRGFLELSFSDGTVVVVPNGGIKCFPKRAVLRMGMLLRDSRVAKEIRTQLLNTFEHATEEQRTYELTKEKQLLCDVVEGIVNEKSADAVTSLTEYVKYKNRYIAEIEQRNAELAQENSKISEQKEKIEEINKDLSATNSALVKTQNTWEPKSILNALVRVYAGKCYPQRTDKYAVAWRDFYKRLKYKYSIDVEHRWKNGGEVGKRISYLKHDELSKAVKVAVAMCEAKKIDTGKIIGETNEKLAKTST